MRNWVEWLSPQSNPQAPPSTRPSHCCRISQTRLSHLWPSMVGFWVWVLGYLGLGTQISGGAPPDPRYLGWVITLPAFLLFHRIHQKSDIFDIFAAALCAAHCTVNTVHQVSGYPKPKYPDIWGGYPDPRYLALPPPNPRPQPCGESPQYCNHHACAQSKVKSCGAGA